MFRSGYIRLYTLFYGYIWFHTFLFFHMGNSKIPFEEIIETIKFLFDNTVFIFNDTIYQQLFGTPMGSSISLLFAGIVMNDLETTCLKLLKEKSNCILLFYYRYIVDTILCIKKDQLESVLDTFNGYDKYLQFTHEIEIDNNINFLDLTIVKRGNNIITIWSQKPTCSG